MALRRLIISPLVSQRENDEDEIELIVSSGHEIGARLQAIQRLSVHYLRYNCASSVSNQVIGLYLESEACSCSIKPVGRLRDLGVMKVNFFKQAV